MDASKARGHLTTLGRNVASTPQFDSPDALSGIVTRWIHPIGVTGFQLHALQGPTFFCDDPPSVRNGPFCVW